VFRARIVLLAAQGALDALDCPRTGYDAANGERLRGRFAREGLAAIPFRILTSSLFATLFCPVRRHIRWLRFFNFVN
jgi:hypothetical protein